MPDEPELDPITEHVIATYLMAARARKVVIGMNGAALLPLTVRDISDVLDAHPSPLPREELDRCIFALDAEDREPDEDSG